MQPSHYFILFTRDSDFIFALHYSTLQQFILLTRGSEFLSSSSNNLHSNNSSSSPEALNLSSTPKIKFPMIQPPHSPLFNSPTIFPPHQRLWIYLHLPPIYIPIIHPPHQRLWIYHQLLQLNSLGFNFLTRGSEFIINSCNRISKDSTSSPGALNLSSLQQLNFQGFTLLIRGSKFIIISTTEFPRIYPPHQGS